jgi:hypothetical protein
VLDPTKETFGFSGSGLKSGDFERNLLPETHLRAFQPASSLVFAFEDINSFSKKAYQSVEALRLRWRQRSTLLPTLESPGRNAEKGGHFFRRKAKPLLDFGHQFSRESLLDRGKKTGEVLLFELVERTGRRADLWRGGHVACSLSARKRHS